MTVLSVFDLDHTLIRRNVSFAFGAYLFRSGRLSVWESMRSTVSYVRYKYIQPSLSALHESVFRAFLRGRSIEEIGISVDQFLDTYFERFIYKPARARLEEAKRLGHHLMLLSGSPDFLVGPIASRLGIDEWEGTCYAVDRDQRVSNVFSFMGGALKAKRALARAKELGCEVIHAFSDSIVDLPLLEIAKKAVGVRPDRLLASLCKNRGWEII